MYDRTILKTKVQEVEVLLLNIVDDSDIQNRFFLIEGYE